MYARRAGYGEPIAIAIEEHHLPYGAAGALPASDTGALLSLADKADTLAVAFQLGIEPTGSRDPYGLRRAAAGLVAVALDHPGWDIGLPGLVGEDAVAFVLDRVDAVLVDEGLTREEVRAARGSGATEPTEVAARARALHEFAGPDRDALRDAYGRSHRIAGDTHAAVEPGGSRPGLPSGSTTPSVRPTPRSPSPPPRRPGRSSPAVGSSAP